MQRIIAVAIALLPIAASAHPDHSSGTYALTHYLSGSHLMMAIAAMAGAYALYRLIRRFLLD